ncbi:hypothetical protein EV356DRAFT_563194 [Viridothelium virens]|uniref:Uncharacterized protein n=1 Tax=Viridothelium virens TaxID=1048519 RepID=A0A6A6HNQ9_VIRVR|nr:hypothetical protein EV356DRAFT_563194 [Viridothelium virens]
MDLTFPEESNTANSTLLISNEVSTNSSCPLVGIDWSTGGKTCVGENGYLLLVIVFIGAFVSLFLMWFSATRSNSEEASRRAQIFKKDAYLVPTRLGLWAWYGVQDDGQRKAKCGHRYNAFQELRPLLHGDYGGEEAYCDYCTMVDRRRAELYAQSGCNV